MNRIIQLFCVLVLIAACKVGPKYNRPDAVSRKSEYSQLPGKKDSITSAKWFDIYEDEALKKLIQLAIDSNKNLLSAIARVDEAKAAAAIVKSNLLPQLNYGAGADFLNAGSNAQQTFIAQNINVYQAKATLNWEIDLFGKIRNAKASAINDYLSREEILKNVQVSLIAEVAANYFLLRDLDNRYAIAERTIVSRKESLRIISERFSKGYISEIDKLQAQQQLSVAEALKPNIKRQIITVENNLNVLCGRSSGQIIRGKTNYEQKLPPSIPVGLPAELLERRPDIQAAEYTLAAQYNRIGVAQANRFPTLSLTAVLGLASPQLSTLVASNSLYNGVGAGLAGPIFAFGQNKRRVDVERKRAEQSLLQYEQVVLIAFAEVESTLGQFSNLGEEYEARKRQVEAAKHALDLSNQRYNTGYTSYLEVLVQENNLLDAELQESAILQQKHNSLVALYKALGGGW
jgi:multidrug efflux system outer membrane protein